MMVWRRCHWLAHGYGLSSRRVGGRGVSLMRCSYWLSSGDSWASDWKSLASVSIRGEANDTQGMYDTRDIAKTCEQNIDTELKSASKLQKYPDRRQ